MDNMTVPLINEDCMRKRPSASRHPLCAGLGSAANFSFSAEEASTPDRLHDEVFGEDCALVLLDAWFAYECLSTQDCIRHLFQH